MDTRKKKLNIYTKSALFIDFLLDLVFPKYCVGCSKEGTWFCDKCKSEIVTIKKPYCPTCQRLTPKGQYCSRCRKNHHLTGVIIAAHYEKRCVLKEAVHTFKYDGVKDLKNDLSYLLVNAMAQYKFSKNLVLIPVPLSKYRQRQRGYNQSEELAKFIAQKTKSNIITNKLVRVKHKVRQVDLPRAKRLKNIKGVFDWIGKDEIKGKTAIIIDDVYTTGATLNECAKIIRQKTKVRQVWGLVLGKG